MQGAVRLLEGSAQGGQVDKPVRVFTKAGAAIHASLDDVERNAGNDQPGLPRQVTGLVKMLGEYQALAAAAAWDGTRLDAIRALAGNPLCFSLPLAERIYDEMAAAHQAYLPERLLR